MSGSHKRVQNLNELVRLRNQNNIVYFGGLRLSMTE